MDATNQTSTAPRERYQGMMTKRIIDMTPDERAAYYEAAIPIIREKLFSIGQPLVHEKDGRLVAEHADGRIEYID